MRRLRIGYNQDGKQEEGIDDSLWLNNKFDGQGESTQDSCKTINYVRHEQ